MVPKTLGRVLMTDMAHPAEAPVRRLPWVTTSLAALAVLMGGVAVLVGWQAGGLTFWAVPAVFAGFGLGCGALAFHVHRRRADSLPLVLLAMGTVVTGPLAAVGVLATLLILPLFARTAKPFDVWLASLFPEEEEDSVARVAQQAGNYDAAGVWRQSPQAMADVFAFGAEADKQHALHGVMRNFHPALGPVLQYALVDDDNAVRIQGAAAMAWLEQGRHRRLGRLRAACDANPHDVDAAYALARELDDQAFSGLLDSRVADTARQEAATLYRQVVSVRTDDSLAWAALGRVLIRQGQVDAAAEVLAHALAVAPSAELALWYMDALFRLGDYDRLRAFAYSQRNLAESSRRLPGGLATTVRAWAGVSAAGEA